jgi:acetylornithine deacetylase/succinyl-diaminopimelate desuccinylase-like protein
MDVEVTGSNTDLHSGSHGGMAYNPLHALIEVLSQLRDPEGKITIPHFYDEVLPLSEKDKEKISFHFDESEYEKTFGTKPTGGEKKFSPLERKSIRPTIEINGISGGYTGEGFKTVIPAKAHAKISCRLVPNQDPQEIANRVAAFLEEKAPLGTKIAVHIHPGGGKAVRANPSSKVVKAFEKAYEEVFNKPCEFIFEGGSIPIITKLSAVSESEVVFVGLGLSTDQIHAPNEHFGLDRLEQGFEIMTRAILNLSS